MPRAKSWRKSRKDKGKKRFKPNINLDSDTSSTQRTPSTSSASSARSSVSSGSKISQNLFEYDEIVSSGEMDLIDVAEFSSELSSFGLCKKCKEGDISCSVVRRIGMAAQIQLICNNIQCQNSHKFMNSEMVSLELSGGLKRMYAVNIRLVYAFRAIGKYKMGASVVCGLMNLPHPPAAWSTYEQAIGTSVKKCAVESMKKSIEEAVIENDGSRDLCIALDGSWQKRGYRSLNGVVAGTSVDTGKVLDVEVLSKFCRCPDKLKDIHAANCSANYRGVSGGMELIGVQRIFERSKSENDVRYVKYLGDGDSKGFKNILSSKPYGDDCIVEKLECVGHVQKRMGAKLRKVYSQMRSKKTQGEKLGELSKLTKNAIDQIQTYYGLSIRRNTEDISKMKKAVWSTFFHIASSDEEPLHTLCDESWCKFKIAAKNGDVYEHEKHFHLPLAVMTFLKPVFRDLANPELLKKCLHGKTQNVNEAFNHVIWNIIPKTSFVTFPTLQLGVYEAVGLYNEGCIHRCRTLQNLGIEPGVFCSEAMLKIDKKRIREANRYNDMILLKMKKRGARKRLENKFEAEEDPDSPSYAAGGH